MPICLISRYYRYIPIIFHYTSAGHKFNNVFKSQYNTNFRSMKIAGQTRALFFSIEYRLVYISQ